MADLLSMLGKGVGPTMIGAGAALTGGGHGLIGIPLAAAGVVKSFGDFVIDPLKKIGKPGFKLMKDAFNTLLRAARQLDNIVGMTASFENLAFMLKPIQLAFKILGAMMKAGTVEAVKTGLRALEKFLPAIVNFGMGIGRLASLPMDVVYGGLNAIADAINMLAQADFLEIGDRLRNVETVIDRFLENIQQSGGNMIEAGEDVWEEGKQAVKNIVNVDLRQSFIDAKEELANQIGEQMGVWFG